MSLLGSYRNVDDPILLCGLLNCITSGDKRLVDLTYQESRELLTKEPSIGEVLRNAWKEGLFKEVRR